jgi:hypothetical protein
MGSKSKEENVLKLFFNDSARHWHFEETGSSGTRKRGQKNKTKSSLIYLSSSGKKTHPLPKS